MRYGIVISKFNEEITSKLLANCLKTLTSAGIKRKDVTVVEVPGGYEIPWALQELALTRQFGVLITLGAVLRGQTPQNDHIASSVISHIHDISLRYRIPCVLGIITPNTWKQALARTRGTMDRGTEAGLAALEMGSLKKNLRGKR